METTLPTAVVKRIMTEAGAQRVSPDAADALGKYLVEKGAEVTKKAVEAAQHAGRQTVKADDVHLATH